MKKAKINFLKIGLALTIIINQLFTSGISVRALDNDIQNPQQETVTVVDLVIDNQEKPLATFENVDRFNQYGIAIVNGDVDSALDKSEIKYGLLKSDGNLVQPLSYDYIYDYDENYFIAYNEVEYTNPQDSSNPYYIHTEGLLSKKTGQIVLDVKYSYIPDLSDRKLISLSYDVISGSNHIWKNELISNNNGVFEPIKTPDGITLADYDGVWPRPLSNGMVIINAYRRITPVQNGAPDWESKCWIADEYGNVLPEFEQNVYSYIDPFTGSDDNYYFTAHKQSTTSQNIISSSLYRIVKASNTIEKLLDDNQYSGIWRSTGDSVEVGYQFSYNYTDEWTGESRSENPWINGTFNVVSATWKNGLDPINKKWTNNHRYWNDTDLTIIETVDYSGSNPQRYMDLALSSDPSKESILDGKSYREIYSPKDGVILLRDYKYNSASKSYDTQASNVLIKKSSSSYLKVFSADISGNAWIDSNNWLHIYQNTDRKIIDLNGISTQIDPANLSASGRLLVDGEGGAWRRDDRYQQIWNKISGVDYHSLYDRINVSVQ